VIIQTLEVPSNLVPDDQQRLTDVKGEVPYGVLAPSYRKLLVIAVLGDKRAKMVIEVANGSFPGTVPLKLAPPIR
jgi:hypothetical protein